MRGSDHARYKLPGFGKASDGANNESTYIDVS